MANQNHKVPAVGPDTSRPSPRAKDQKQVTFELLLPVMQHRARLPMRVMISRHDTTDSIITTVKNFYGLYDGPGVSFQDRHGNILIAAYENFEDNMTIYVKVTPEDTSVRSTPIERSPRNSISPKKPKLGAPFEMRPPSHPTRLGSQAMTQRSPSPSSNRSNRSLSTAPASWSRPKIQRSQDSNSNEADNNADTLSDSDGGNGSVTSSRRSKAEPHASAEISVDNIVEGGRRKRAKFESSELPLFVPPQVPMTTSVSSASPLRRPAGEMASPMPFNNQRTFVYAQPLPSPQSYGRAEGQYVLNGQSTNVYGQVLPYNGHQLRGRGTVNYLPPRQSTGGILPTPEPTVGSVISDEDVALQLMRLGDASNYSHGRTSTSTADDALSGKAEAPSSGEESDDDEQPVLPANPYQSNNGHNAGPARKKQRVAEDKTRSDSVDSSGDDYNDDSFKGDSDEIIPETDSGALDQYRLNKSKAGSKVRGSVSSVTGSSKSGKNRPSANGLNTKVKSQAKVPMSPASIPSQSRKASIGSTATLPNLLGPDEEDLSAKPRCQRCRRSKKGCDRQRPCGRCKDAGIGIEGCLSEDEGNGRRGRYGRHMGVSIKKEAGDFATELGSAYNSPSSHGQFLAPALPTSQNNKKRKR